MSNPVIINSFKLLDLMVNFDRDDFSADWLKQNSGLSPGDVNDAIDYLKNNGAIQISKPFGSAPFDFDSVFVKPKGRLLYHEHKDDLERSKQINQAVGSRKVENDIPELLTSINKFWDDYPSDTKIAFIMMQFEDTPLHSQLVKVVKDTLLKYDVIGLRADDKQYATELYGNIRTYMHCADFGIAIFERIIEDDFNPNVSLEVGYLLGLKKGICFLKDKNLKKLPTDIIGHLYKEFDPHDIDNTLPVQLEKWLHDMDWIKKKEVMVANESQLRNKIVELIQRDGSLSISELIERINENQFSIADETVKMMKDNMLGSNGHIDIHTKLFLVNTDARTWAAPVKSFDRNLPNIQLAISYPSKLETSSEPRAVVDFNAPVEVKNLKYVNITITNIGRESMTLKILGMIIDERLQEFVWQPAFLAYIKDKAADLKGDELKDYEYSGSKLGVINGLDETIIVVRANIFTRDITRVFIRDITGVEWDLPKDKLKEFLNQFDIDNPIKIVNRTI